MTEAAARSSSTSSSCTASSSRSASPARATCRPRRAPRLADPVRLVPPRGGAANMAEAYGKLTGRPGSASSRAAPARPTPPSACTRPTRTRRRWCSSSARCRAATPAARRSRSSTTRRVFGAIAKWVGADRRRRADPRAVARAFAVATAGRPGPVVLALPEDVLDEEADAADAAPTEVARRHPVTRSCAPGGAAAAAERPLVVVGEGGWTAQAATDAVAFCEANALPGRGVLSLPGLRRQRARVVYAGHLDDRPRSRARAAGAGSRPARRARRRGSATSRPAATRCSTCRGRARRSSTSIPTRASSGASTSPTSRSSPASREFAAALRRLQPHRGPALERLD